MCRLKVPLLLIALVTCLTPGLPFAANTQADKALLSESFAQFDQNPDSGWNSVIVQGKYAQAAKFIKQYRSLHSKTLLKWQKASLAYHLGEVYSLANEPHKAIHWYREALAPKLLGNPAYVNAHIAFDAGDRQALLRARRKITALEPGRMRTADLDEINAMINYFGRPFEAAFGAVNCLERTSPLSPEWRAFCTAMRNKYNSLYKQKTKHLMPQYVQI